MPHYFVYVRNMRGQATPQMWYGLQRRDNRVKGALETIPHLQRTPITEEEAKLTLDELTQRYPYINVNEPTTEIKDAPSAT